MPREALKHAEPATQTKPVLAVGLGRGGTGKSVGLAEMAWRAAHQGREVIIADGDSRSQTLSGLFPDAVRPISEEIPDVKDFLTALLDRVVLEQRSAVLDLGGGDRSLVEFGRDLALVDFCQSVGVEPLAVYFLGPEPEDLAHVMTLWRAEFFRPERTILIMNGGVIRNGRTVAGAFDATTSSGEAAEMVQAGAKILFMKPLAVMDVAKSVGLYGVLSGRGSMGPTREIMVRQWLKNLEAERSRIGVDGWLP